MSRGAPEHSPPRAAICRAESLRVQCPFVNIETQIQFNVAKRRLRASFTHRARRCRLSRIGRPRDGSFPLQSAFAFDGSGARVRMRHPCGGRHRSGRARLARRRQRRRRAGAAGRPRIRIPLRPQAAPAEQATSAMTAARAGKRRPRRRRPTPMRQARASQRRQVREAPEATAANTNTAAPRAAMADKAVTGTQPQP